MQQVNETIAFDGKPYRVLFTESSYFYWIVLDENKGLPERIYFDQCNVWIDERRVEKISDPYAYLQAESWDIESSNYQESQKHHELIKLIVEGEGAFNKSTRAKKISYAIAISDKGKSTIYRLVRRYWQRGQIKNSLLPDYNNSGAAGKNESGSNGEIPSADMGGGMQDCTDHSEEYASRFTAFNMMVKMLEEKYACTIIDSHTHELDQVGRSKCHLIDSGAKRTIRCVVVELNGHVNYLLEVDVTGLSASLSTKCVRQIDTRSWQEQFSKIKKGWQLNLLGGP